MPEPAAKLGTLKPDQLATRIGRIKAKREKDAFQRDAQRDMMKAAKAKSLSMPKKSTSSSSNAYIPEPDVWSPISDDGGAVDGGGKRKDGGGKRKAKEIKELDAKDTAWKATPEDIARLRFLRWQRSGHSSKQKKKERKSKKRLFGGRGTRRRGMYSVRRCVGRVAMQTAKYELKSVAHNIYIDK